MNSNKTNKLKLLIAGAFVSFSHYAAFGQFTPYAVFTANQSTSIDICEGDSALMTAISFNSMSNTFKWFYVESGQAGVQVSTASNWYASKPGHYEVQEFDANGSYVGGVSLPYSHGCFSTH